MITARTPRRASPKAPAYRLDLTIGGTTYAIAPLPEAPVRGGRAFRLTKADGTAYDVAQTAYGPECDCPDFIFRRDGLDPEGCKHVKALVGSGLIAKDDRPLANPPRATSHSLGLRGRGEAVRPTPGA